MKQAIGLAIALTATVLLAGERRGGPDMTEYLQLTAAQQASWQNARAEFDATIEPLARQAAEIGERIESSLQSNADACSIGKDIVAQHAIHLQLRAAKQALEQKQQSVLTSEQKTKLDAFKAARGDEERMMKRRSF